MLSRVKKFRDKFFSSTRTRDSADHSEDGTTSPSSSSQSAIHHHASSPSSTHTHVRDFFKRKDSSHNRHAAVDDTAKLEPMEVPGNRCSNVARCSSNLGEVHAAKDALPVVQVNAGLPFGRDKPLSPIATVVGAGSTGQMLGSPSGSGRRKSTPAELDFVLRCAEGRQAVEELLNHNNKKLVFGQYFSGNTSGAPGMQLPPPSSLLTIASTNSHRTATPKQSAFSRLTSSKSPSSSTEQVPSGPLLSHGSPAAGVSEQVAGSGIVSRHADHWPITAPVIEEDCSPNASIPSLSVTASAPLVGAAALSVGPGAPHRIVLPSAAMALQAAACVPGSCQDQREHHVPGLGSESGSTMAQAVTSTALVAAAPTSRVVSFAPPPGAEGVAEAAGPRDGATAVAGGSAAPAGAAAPKQNKLIVVSPTLPAAMNRKHWALLDYNIVRKMYTGYASTVYQALCKRSLEMVALKVYHLENLCELNHYQVYREIRVHAGLHHQHIIHLYAAFQEGTDVVLVQEFAEGGDLYRLLHKNGGRLHERQMVEMVLHPFLLALHYLHTNGIMHRDIKPENVLFTENRVLKLADFGLAIDLNEERAVTRAGTLDYMAPEVLRCPPKNLPLENKNNPYLHYNNSVDAWAVGVFAYELVVGFPPFAGATQLDSVDKIMHSMPDFPEKITELAKDFICQALRKHPGDRPTVIEMLHHPWVRTYQRRTSVRITDMRRRSFVSAGPTSTVAAMQEGTSEGEGEEGGEEGTDAGADRAAGVSRLPDGVVAASGASQWPLPSTESNSSDRGGHGRDISDLTPDEIDGMIRRLQAAKMTAIARGDSDRS